MPESSSCSCCSTMRLTAWASVLRDRDRRGFDPELAQQAVGARTAGLEPDLVQPQDVGLGVAPRRIADLTQRIHQRQELGRKLREYTAHDLPAATRQAAGQGAVGAPAHRNVIVDVDQLARKAVGE